MVTVLSAMQQGARASESTALFIMDQLVEFGSTCRLFSIPREKAAEGCVMGRFEATHEAV